MLHVLTRRLCSFVRGCRTCLLLHHQHTRTNTHRRFRRLAMKHHPDIDIDSREEFASICEAYDVLSNGEWAVGVVLPHEGGRQQQARLPPATVIFSKLAADLRCLLVVLMQPAAKLKGTYDLYGEEALKTTTADGASCAAVGDMAVSASSSCQVGGVGAVILMMCLSVTTAVC